MRVAVIGAGVIGVTTAYELCADGHDVTVLERRGTVAAEASFANPFKSLWISFKGVRTEGPMAPEISLDRQRPAQYVFTRHVEQVLAKFGRPKVRTKEPAAGG